MCRFNAKNKRNMIILLFFVVIVFVVVIYETRLINEQYKPISQIFQSDNYKSNSINIGMNSIDYPNDYIISDRQEIDTLVDAILETELKLVDYYKDNIIYFEENQMISLRLGIPSVTVSIRKDGTVYDSNGNVYTTKEGIVDELFPLIYSLIGE